MTCLYKEGSTLIAGGQAVVTECGRPATRGATANGLSPIPVCDEHGRRFRNKWRDHLEHVRVDPL